MTHEEQRVHARIHVTTEIEVTTPNGTVAASLRDLSKGGARFVAASAVGAVGDTVELYLPALSGEEIAVMAQLIRVTEAEGRYTAAVRFDVVEPAHEQALHDLIAVLLSSTGGEGRAHARVARRMEIHFGRLPELRAILEDISAGGLSMTVADPLVLYEDLDVTVPDTAGEQLLILRARVVNQRAVEDEGGRQYRVGLAFAELRPETRRCLDELLGVVVETLGAMAAP